MLLLKERHWNRITSKLMHDLTSATCCTKQQLEEYHPQADQIGRFFCHLI